MGDWWVRELDCPIEVFEAAEDVMTWGFPRPIEASELERGFWFRMGKGVVWWYEEPMKERPQAALVHFAIAPRLRGGRWPVRRWLVAVEVLAEMMGASELLFAPVQNGSDIAQYALRMGWVPDGPCFRKPLGG